MFLKLYVLCVILVCVSMCSGASVRILEGVERSSDKDDTKLDYVTPPNLMSGPKGLNFLKGSCFSEWFDRYEYTVCPFQNVTQRRSLGVKPSLIGLWGQWKTSSKPYISSKATNSNSNQKSNAFVSSRTNMGASSAHLPSESSSPAAAQSEQTDSELESIGEPGVRYYTKMKYLYGKTCGNGFTTTFVNLQCAQDRFSLIEVDDKRACRFSITLGLPIACSLLTSGDNVQSPTEEDEAEDEETDGKGKG
jgi:hypothetical protein